MEEIKVEEFMFFELVCSDCGSNEFELKPIPLVMIEESSYVDWEADSSPVTCKQCGSVMPIDYLMTKAIARKKLVKS